MDILKAAKVSPDAAPTGLGSPVSTWLLPPPAWAGPRAKPYRSKFKMTEAEAMRRGAIAIVRGTTEHRSDLGTQTAGIDGAKGLPVPCVGPAAALQDRGPTGERP